MEAEGAKVLVAQADVSRAEDVARVLSEARASMAPLRGVIHCAGVLSDKSFGRQTWESFEQVLSPKAEGAWNLHTQTQA